MKLNKDEFRNLQNEWYQKLSKEGFRDIEKLKGDELVLSQFASHCFCGMDVLSRFLKEQYFRYISQIALDEDTFFRNDIDRHILIRHSEGAMIKVIVEELEDMGSPRHRHSVRFIIRRYQIKWGLRKYSDKQLNKKR